MAGPNKPNDRNNNQNDNKKKAPIGFLGIVLWAVVLVRLDAVSLPAGVRAYLDACLAGVGAEPRPEWGVRFVPCQTVAGHCLLPALPAALGSNGRKQDGIYAACCDMPPSPGGWTALVSAETAALRGK